MCKPNCPFRHLEHEVRQSLSALSVARSREAQVCRCNHLPVAVFPMLSVREIPLSTCLITRVEHESRAHCANGSHAAARLDVRTSRRGAPQRQPPRPRPPPLPATPPPALCARCLPAFSHRLRASESLRGAGAARVHKSSISYSFECGVLVAAAPGPEVRDE